MGWLDWLRLASTVLTAWNAVVCIGMVVDYNRLSDGRWRMGPNRAYGWLVMGTIGSLGAIFAFIFGSRVLGDSAARQVVGFLLFLGLSVCLPWWWRLMRLSQARRRSTVDGREGGARMRPSLFARARKALFSGFSAGATAAYAQWQNLNAGGMTGEEWAGVVGTFLAVGVPVALATYRISNAPDVTTKDGEHRA